MNENGNVLHGPSVRVACPRSPSSFTHNATSVSGASESSYFSVLGTMVAQMVEALRYKPEGRGFDSLWLHWNSSLT
jgi:hypothetical protein